MSSNFYLLLQEFFDLLQNWEIKQSKYNSLVFSLLFLQIFLILMDNDYNTKEPLEDIFNGLVLDKQKISLILKYNEDHSFEEIISLLHIPLEIDGPFNAIINLNTYETVYSKKIKLLLNQIIEQQNKQTLVLLSFNPFLFNLIKKYL